MEVFAFVLIIRLVHLLEGSVIAGQLKRAHSEHGPEDHSDENSGALNVKGHGTGGGKECPDSKRGSNRPQHNESRLVGRPGDSITNERQSEDDAQHRGKLTRPSLHQRRGPDIMAIALYHMSPRIHILDSKPATHDWIARP